MPSFRSFQFSSPIFAGHFAARIAAAAFIEFRLDAALIPRQMISLTPPRFFVRQAFAPFSRFHTPH
jgi:hypothetical protein